MTKEESFDYKEYNKSSIQYKREYLWRLAKHLHDNKTFMSGNELADHFNRNEIKTSYGSQYEGGRGTYTLIRAVWNYYQYEINDPQKAHYIASAFVNSRGEYAYE